MKANKLILTIIESSNENDSNNNHIQDWKNVEENDENLFSDDENMEESEKDENSFAFENKNNEEQKLSFPLYYNSNPSYFFPNIEDDELNPFKDLHTSKAKEYKFWDGDDNECIQFNFEYIVSKAQLILPFFHFI